MSDFKIIETQEEFDKAIKSRLAQKDRELEETYKDYLSPDKVTALKAEYEEKLTKANESLKEFQEKLSSHDKVVSELTERANKAERSLLKNRIASENGLPLELAGRLVGDTEDDLKKDAETLAQFLKPTHTPPMRTSETGAKANASDACYAQLLANITKTE